MRPGSEVPLEQVQQVVEKFMHGCYDSDEWVDWFAHNTGAAVEELLKEGPILVEDENDDSDIDGNDHKRMGIDLDSGLTDGGSGSNDSDDSDDSDIEVSMTCCMCFGAPPQKEKRKGQRKSSGRQGDQQRAARDYNRQLVSSHHQVPQQNVAVGAANNGNVGEDKVAKKLFDTEAESNVAGNDQQTKHADVPDRASPFNSPLIKRGSEADLELNKRIDAGVANLLHLLSSAKGDQILKEEAKHFSGDLKKAKAIMVFQVRQQIKGRFSKQVQQFSELDADGDGSVSALELASVLRNMGHEVTVQHAERLIAQMDSNGDGAVDFREFLVKFSMNDILAQTPKNKLSAVGEGSMPANVPQVPSRDGRDEALSGGDSDELSSEDAASLDEDCIGKADTNVMEEVEEQDEVSELDIQRAFDLLDIDGNGTLTAMDLVLYYASSVELSRENAEAIIAAGDPTGQKGGLDRSDFAQLPVFNRVIGRRSALPPPPMQDPDMPPSEHARQDYQHFRQWVSVWALDHLLGIFIDLGVRSISQLSFVTPGDLVRAGASPEDLESFSTAVHTTELRAARERRGLLVYGQESRDRLLALRRAFDQNDLNGDGVLSVNEIIYTLKAVGITVNRGAAEKLVDELDQNGDGLISFEELVCYKEFRFIHANSSDTTSASKASPNRSAGVSGVSSGGEDDSSEAMEPASEQQLSELRRKFEEFDADGSGQITMDELVDGVKAVGLAPEGEAESYAERVMTRFDRDGDGTIDMDEFMLFQIHLKQSQMRRASLLSRKNEALENMRRSPPSTPRRRRPSAREGMAKRSEHAHQSDVQRMREAFGHRRSLSIAELLGALDTIGEALTPDEAKEVADRLDDGKGQISVDEFLLWHASPHRESEEERELALMREAFQYFDTNGDGQVDLGELMQAMASLNKEISGAEAMDIIERFDKDGVGSISVDEFVSWKETQMARQSDAKNHISPRAPARSSSKPVDLPVPADAPRDSTSQYETLLARFEKFDADADGRLSVQELREAMKGQGRALSSADVQAVLESFDTDGDGSIDFKEFAAWQSQEPMLGSPLASSIVHSTTISKDDTDVGSGAGDNNIDKDKANGDDEEDDDLAITEAELTGMPQRPLLEVGKKQLAVIRKIFADCDTDEDGFVAVEDIAKRVPFQRAVSIVKQYDWNGDQLMDFHDFAQWVFDVKQKRAVGDGSEAATPAGPKKKKKDRTKKKPGTKKVKKKKKVTDASVAVGEGRPRSSSSASASSKGKSVKKKAKSSKTSTERKTEPGVKQDPAATAEHVNSKKRKKKQKRTAGSKATSRSAGGTTGQANASKSGSGKPRSSRSRTNSNVSAGKASDDGSGTASAKSSASTMQSSKPTKRKTKKGRAKDPKAGSDSAAPKKVQKMSETQVSYLLVGLCMLPRVQGSSAKGDFC